MYTQGPTPEAETLLCGEMGHVLVTAGKPVSGSEVETQREKDAAGEGGRAAVA